MTFRAQQVILLYAVTIMFAIATFMVWDSIFPRASGLEAHLDPIGQELCGAKGMPFLGAELKNNSFWGPTIRPDTLGAMIHCGDNRHIQDYELKIWGESWAD